MIRPLFRFYGRSLSNISFVFGAMEFQEKMLLRFTDLYYIGPFWQISPHSQTLLFLQRSVFDNFSVTIGSLYSIPEQHMRLQIVAIVFRHHCTGLQSTSQNETLANQISQQCTACTALLGNTAEDWTPFSEGTFLVLSILLEFLKCIHLTFSGISWNCWHMRIRMLLQI